MEECDDEWVARGEQWKLAPGTGTGTGTASSGVPVWPKDKTPKSKPTFHPFY